MTQAAGNEPGTSPTKRISWNPSVRLVLSDVDETVADLYTAAPPETVRHLSDIAAHGTALFFITGQSLKSVNWRIIDSVPPALRGKMLVGACNGAEVWGFDTDGKLREKPHYSLYDSMMTTGQKTEWRTIVDRLIAEFRLEVHPATPLAVFAETAGNNPFAIMMEDRGPQITFEMANAYSLAPEQVSAMGIDIPCIHGTYDLRQAVLAKAAILFAEADLPVTPRLGGIFALDFALKGVNKTTSVKHALENGSVLASVGLTPEDLRSPESMEVWGDRFSVIGGSDRHMSEAVDPRVRSIDFRKEEDPSEFPKGYNIVLWNGSYRLQDGLLEYLGSRS